MFGPTVQFTADTRIALTGATWEAALDDGSRIAGNRVHDVRAGAVLRVGRAVRGARGYLACAGGFDTAVVLGSRATHVGARLGGVDGRALRAGDVIALGSRVGAARPCRTSEWGEPPADGARVRVVRGPHADWFSSASIDVFTAARYVVTPESDRMGYRLDGRALSHGGEADIISEAVTIGTIQVPGDGRPIVLMADRQTTGGYPKLATVIAADIGMVGQLAPGAWVAFEWCSRQDAAAALLARERAFL
jgi:biotin-dependent carboxylase-like uncharacterized protein